MMLCMQIQNEDHLLLMLRELERTLEETAGWDQPATIWQIRLPDEATQHLLQLPTDTLGLELLSVLEGHPREAMTGLRAASDAIGVVLVTEGWTYSEERKKQSPLYQPSQYKDSREMRLAFLVLRTGEEAVLHHIRGQEPQVGVVGGEDHFLISGPISWVTRRVIGLPSRADSPSEAVIPDPTEVFKLYAVAARLRAFLDVCAQLDDDALQHEAAHQLVTELLTIAPTDEEMHINALSWEASRAGCIEEAKRLRLVYAESEEWERFAETEESIRITEWYDAPLFAVEVADKAPSLESLADVLLRFARSRPIPASLLRLVGETLGINPPYGSWSVLVKPGRNEPCPCGSTKHFKHCHGRRRP